MFEVITIYEWYDGPVLYSAKNKEQDIYLFVLLNDEDGLEYLVIPFPIDLSQDLHTMFKTARYKYIYKYPQNTFYEFLDELTDDMLPLPGEFLNG